MNISGIWKMIGCITLCMALYIGYAMLGPVDNVTEVYNIPFPVDKQFVHVGDVITYHVLYCRPNNYITIIHRYIVDLPSGKRTEVSSVITNLKPTAPDCNEGKPAEAFVKVEIPKTMGTGEKQILIETEYIINALGRKAEKSSWTQPFTVN